MKLYDREQIENLKKRYEELWWDRKIIWEWTLLDEYLFFWEWLKFCIARDHYLNERSSCYKVNFYKKLPKKYENLLYI